MAKLRTVTERPRGGEHVDSNGSNSGTQRSSRNKRPRPRRSTDLRAGRGPDFLPDLEKNKIKIVGKEKKEWREKLKLYVEVEFSAQGYDDAHLNETPEVLALTSRCRRHQSAAACAHTYNK